MDSDYPIPSEIELGVSQEFLKWYRALINIRAVELVSALHARLDKLRFALPSAGEVLDKVLAEAEGEALVDR